MRHGGRLVPALRRSSSSSSSPSTVVVMRGIYRDSNGRPGGRVGRRTERKRHDLSWAFYRRVRILGVKVTWATLPSLRLLACCLSSIRRLIFSHWWSQRPVVVVLHYSVYNSWSTTEQQRTNGIGYSHAGINSYGDFHTLSSFCPHKINKINPTRWALFILIKINKFHTLRPFSPYKK
jgi:hypothetical protein